ncbi:hypothetical protein [Enterococcus sp. AZ109]|uniref:hypothetical protein n=1 Tax=Enterococcus sp. AZ109 TaxID=2774634 RepID=UPI003F253065
MRSSNSEDTFEVESKIKVIAKEITEQLSEEDIANLIYDPMPEIYHFLMDYGFVTSIFIRQI